MMKDRLYLLDNVFPDADLPGRTFYCRDCITLHGLLAAFPERCGALDVIRSPFPRPRVNVVEQLGEAHQWLPVLVFAPDAPAELADAEHQGVRFVTDMKRLLHALHVRHGFPEAHP
ncbi:DUF3088 family protein [Sphingomonas sp. ASY06-1R]|jgi:hypothetical protein|uniref:DUF3088 family protein n=1 Tax=Sphingomonas sp. ASY06-1R TaxID=3445771 RepID=UPI003FA1FE7A